MTAVLDVTDLSVEIRTGSGIVRALDRVASSVGRGETLALVGESGCGRSTLVRLIARLTRPTAGSIRFGTRELSALPAKASARDPGRARIQIVVQDAGDSIPPRFPEADAIADPLRQMTGLSGVALHEGVRSGGALRAAAGIALPLRAPAFRWPARPRRDRPRDRPAAGPAGAR
ncbi:ATP-binding cassette domain-containing protein [Dankookia rubra]|nr:ATP-binding cassette domain-containing protein [Dankookia rubra]